MIQRYAIVPIPESVPTQALGNLRATISTKEGADSAKPVSQAPVFPQDTVDFSPEAQRLLASQGSAAPQAVTGNPATVAAAQTRGTTTKPGAPNTNGDSAVSGTTETDAKGEPLSAEEQQQVRELESRDREVRTHEQAHLAAAGPYATSGPTYSYQQGPDGKRYAIGGEVGIDTSPVEGDPAATARKARVVRAAALAPAEPSAQDRAVAAQATQLEQKALAEQRAQAQESAGLSSDPSSPARSAPRNNPYSASSAPASGQLLNLIA